MPNNHKINNQRWYKGFSHKGDPNKLIELISKKVNEHDLSNFIPLVRIEKKVKKYGNYYFFIAVDNSISGALPEDVKNYLMVLPCFKFPIPRSPSFTYEQIKSMVGAAHDVFDCNNPIPYNPIETIQDDDPFDIFSVNNQLNYQNNSQNYQQLLYWLSSVGYGTWELFKKTCFILGLDEPKRVLRKLKLLGHLETSSDGKKWSIAPTALVKIKSLEDISEYTLCGQQNKKLIRKLEILADIDTINQPNVPYCIRLKLINLTNIETVIYKIKNEINVSISNSYNIAQKLAEILPNLEQWKLSLKPLQGIVKSLYDWKYFQNGDFVECTLPEKTGMYQMWDRESKNAPRRTLFYEQDIDTWRQCDWYGLRFLALSYSQHDLIARYNPESLQLAIPHCQMWPELYERALVLASGLLPKYHKTEEQNLWLIYENISLDLAHQLTQKLMVNCQEEII
ncbi:hypothetical protein [Chroococcus sp. FPU101]|uniref:hypothetical protein n=1 Tax=Chroococcus sp. FPU101 TaxID=1974212 RepID=UPI001A8DF0BA|nr:hypothetical protein [Chroococcus sp. FPU101]